ncbi:hypothetical protein GN956_G11689 [Arapaima gigas]
MYKKGYDRVRVGRVSPYMGTDGRTSDMGLPSRRRADEAHSTPHWTAACSSPGHIVSVMAHSSKVPAHVLVLLKNLNYQRERGQFCDCVIRLQLSPGKLYLAHKNILAASSPVLASLLSSQGTLLDLQFPDLTHETLELLLEFIYTGSLPPPGLEDSLHSAATCLEMEELLHALDYRWTVSSESPKNMEADENASNLTRFVKAQTTERTNKTESHCQVSEWRRQSYEVVPVIHHAGDLNHNFKVYDTSVKGTTHSGLSAEHHGLSRATGQEPVMPGTKHPTYCSVIRDTVSDKVLDTVTETPHRCHPGAKKDVVAEVCTKGKSVITNSLCPGTAGECIRSVHTIAQCSPVKQSNDASTEISSLTVFIDQEGRFDQQPVDICSHLSKTLKSHRMAESGNLPLTKLPHSKNNDNIPSPNLNNSPADLKIRANADRQSAKKKKYNLIKCVADDCQCSSDSWSPENRNSYSQTCVEKRLDETIATNPDPWNVTANSCTENDGVAQKITKAPTSTITTQKDTGLSIPDVGREKECFFRQQQNDLPDYHGQVTYHYLHSQRRGTSNSEDEGLNRVVADVDVSAREHPRISPKQPAVDFSESMETPGGSSSSSNQSHSQTSPMGLVGAQQYKCTVCERAFSQRGSLNRHLRSHLGVRPYPCPRCPMTFSRQYRVLEHLRVHQRSCHSFQRTGPT